MEPYTGPIKDIDSEAYVVHRPSDPFVLSKVIYDEIRSDEILITMKYTGICHSVNLLLPLTYEFPQVTTPGCIYATKFDMYPAIYGHEGSGHILALGSSIQNKDLKVGDAVLLTFNSCGKCSQCTTGHAPNCQSFVYNLSELREDGSLSARLSDGTKVVGQFFGQSSFSRISIVKERSDVKVSGEDELNLYSSLGCGFRLACAGTILNALKPPPASSIAIFGLGSVGLIAIMAAESMNV